VHVLISSPSLDGMVDHSVSDKNRMMRLLSGENFRYIWPFWHSTRMWRTEKRTETQFALCIARIAHGLFGGHRLRPMKSGTPVSLAAEAGCGRNESERCRPRRRLTHNALEIAMNYNRKLQCWMCLR